MDVVAVKLNQHSSDLAWSGAALLSVCAWTVFACVVHNTLICITLAGEVNYEMSLAFNLFRQHCKLKQR